MVGLQAEDVVMGGGLGPVWERGCIWVSSWVGLFGLWGVHGDVKIESFGIMLRFKLWVLRIDDVRRLIWDRVQQF